MRHDHMTWKDFYLLGYALKWMGLATVNVWIVLHYALSQYISDLPDQQKQTETRSTPRAQTSAAPNLFEERKTV